MRLLTLVNRTHDYKRFVFDRAILETIDSILVLIFELRPRANSKPRCSQCGMPGPCYDTAGQWREFEHPPLWNIPVRLRYRMRRVDCPSCGVKVEGVPWAEGKRRYTREYRHLLATWARRLSWQETASVFRTSWNTVFRAVRDTVEWGLAHRCLEGISAIGVDEVQIGRWHNYMTLIYQIDEGHRRLLAVRPGRSIKTIMRCLRDIGREHYAKIAYVCSDMWKPYLKVIARRLPHALNILDKFHIVAHLNKAVDQVRREETRRLHADGYEPVLAKTKYCFLKRPENLTPRQESRLADVLSYSLKSVRAYLIKESFQALWTYESPYWAWWFWKKWSTRVMRSRIEPLKNFVKTMRRHEHLMFNYWIAKKRFTAGVVEGLNRKVNLVTRKAYGYRNPEIYRIALFHSLGDLPEPRPGAHRFC